MTTKVHLGHRGVMNLVPYQLDPALQALRQPRLRDPDCGFGRPRQDAPEAGVLATELIQRGRGKRILVVTQKAMLTQFQKEWWSRFSTTAGATGFSRPGSGAQPHPPPISQPFNYFDRSIISIDTLKSNLEYRNYLRENAWWDIIVIDECHNVAARAGESGLAPRPAGQVAGDALGHPMLLSATPARRLGAQLCVADESARPHGHLRPRRLHARRLPQQGPGHPPLQKDIRDQVSADFQERVTNCLRAPASAQEEAAYRALLEIPFTQGGLHKTGKQQSCSASRCRKRCFPARLLRWSPRRSASPLLQRQGQPDRGRRPARSKHWATLKRRSPRWPRTQRPASSANTSASKQHLQSTDFGWEVKERRRPPGHLLRAHRNPALAARAPHHRPQAQAPTNSKCCTARWPTPSSKSWSSRFGRLDDPLRVLLCSDVASGGPQPALLLPPPGAPRPALVADGVPAAQRPRVDRFTVRSISRTSSISSPRR